ncbi:MAG: adenine phosphoribosyltransferase, partial [Acinetobacter sp.]
LMHKCEHTVLGASIFLDLPDLHQDLGMKVWSVLDENAKPVAQAVA